MMVVRLLCAIFVLLLSLDGFVYKIECDELDDIMKQFDLLKEKVDKSGLQSKELTASVDRLRKDVIDSKAKPDNKYMKGAKKGLEVAQKLVGNFEKFTSGDALKIASGAVDLLGTIGGFIPVAGPIISSICGIIASIIPMFGGKKKSMEDVMKKVIKEALEDFRDDRLQEKITESKMRITSFMGYLTTLSKQSTLSKDTINQLQNPMYFDIGLKVLAPLKHQINKNKRTKDKKMASKIAKYCFSYAMVSLQIDIMLTLIITLLKKNNVNDGVAALTNHLTHTVPRRDQETLGFISDIPEGKNWTQLYRSLHVDLVTAQRNILESYRIKSGCKPMEGTLARIYNKHWKTYLYSPSDYYSGNDKTSRHVFTWKVEEKDLSEEYLFRIFGDFKKAKIYNIHGEEYLYVTTRLHHMKDGKRRKVFFGRDGKSHYKGMKWDMTGTTIRNLFVNEYMYAASFFYRDEPRRWVFTWMPGGKSGADGEWEIKELSYTEDKLIEKKTM